MSKIVSKELDTKLGHIQQILYDEKIPVIITFEGPGGEVSGKIVNNFISLLEPRGVSYHHIVNGSEVKYNKATHFFSNIPGKGKICVYDRAWYSLILDTKYEKKRFNGWVEGLNNFEAYLNNNGILVVKVFLNMSRETEEKYHDIYVGEGERSALVDPFSEHNFDAKSKDVSEMIKKSSVVFPWDIVDVGEPKETMDQILKIFINRVSDLIREPKGRMVMIKDTAKFPNPRQSMDLSKTISDKDYDHKLEKLQLELSNLQEKLAVSNKSLVIAFEGWDAAGKGGAIRRITQALSPRGYKAISIAAPTAEEKSKTHLWRFASRLPDDGHIVIFDRTWYGRMMVEPIEGFCSDEEYERAGPEINGFELFMVENRTILIKFWIEISKDEQLRRFNERRLDPLKRWKITDEDWRNRKKWDVYEKYVDQMMKRTNTPYAPWHVVESNDKKYARIKVLETVVSVLKKELKD